MLRTQKDFDRQGEKNMKDVLYTSTHHNYGMVHFWSDSFKFFSPLVKKVKCEHESMKNTLFRDLMFSVNKDFGLVLYFTAFYLCICYMSSKKLHFLGKKFKVLFFGFRSVCYFSRIAFIISEIQDNA